MDGLPQVTAPRELLGEGLELISFLADHKVFPSRGEARKMIQNGGLSINLEKVTAIDHQLTAAQLLNDRYLLIRKGKNYTLAIFN